MMQYFTTIRKLLNVFVFIRYQQTDLFKHVSQQRNLAFTHWNENKPSELVSVKTPGVHLFINEKEGPF